MVDLDVTKDIFRNDLVLVAKTCRVLSSIVPPPP